MCVYVHICIYLNYILLYEIVLYCISVCVWCVYIYSVCVCVYIYIYYTLYELYFIVLAVLRVNIRIKICYYTI